MKEEEAVVLDKENNNHNRKKLLIALLVSVSIFLVIGILSILFTPKLTLNGDNYIKLKLNTPYVEKGVVVTMNGKNISNKVNINGNVDITKPGKYDIEYSVKEGFITKTVKRTVEVIDDVFPTIELIGTEKAIVCPDYEYKEEGYKATDNYDGDITDSVVVLERDNLITYTVKDSSNNETIVSREIIKRDDEKPTITLIGPSTKYVLLNSNYTDQGVLAEDNCDKDISKKVVLSGSVDTSKKGTYKLVYEVKDSSGNSSKIERKVVVYDKASSISGVAKTGTIYLTFDDGPSSTITPGILKILKEKGVKATFFVINHSDSLNYLIKKEQEDGHTVALHSYTHNYSQIYQNVENYFYDLSLIQDKIKSITGINSMIIRFPGGSSNTVSRSYNRGIMTYLTKEVQNRGFVYFDWNVSSEDAGGARDEFDVYKNVVGNLKYANNIVLLHDFEGNYKTLNAIRNIIKYGKENGYRFEALEYNSPKSHHGVNN